MKTHKVYDYDYAKQYDQRFLTSDYAKNASDFELTILKNLIKPNSTWLDAGCGTGYFMSFFQDINRCGIDISPDMLQIAKERNRTAQFIEGDFREVLPSLKEVWDLVSCMWTPYNYLNSMYEFDDFLKNLVHVTNVGGCLFIPVVDLEDLRPHTILEYDMKTGEHGGNIFLTSSTWTWVETDATRIHKHLVAPQIDYFVESLNGFFEIIEIIRYPIYQEGWVSRKAILAKNKLDIPIESSEVIKHSFTNKNIKVSEDRFEEVSVSKLLKILFKKIFFIKSRK